VVVLVDAIVLATENVPLVAMVTFPEMALFPGVKRIPLAVELHGIIHNAPVSETPALKSKTISFCCAMGFHDDATVFPIMRIIFDPLVNDALNAEALAPDERVVEIEFDTFINPLEVNPVNVPSEVMLGCALVVTVPAVVAEVALGTAPDTFAPGMDVRPVAGP
jgi:hypothetical protein